MAEASGEGTSVLSLLRPLKGHVILEPAYDPEETDAGLYVPLDAQQRYPQVGECIASASSQIEVGDFCLINVESSDVARTYNKVFALHLKDWGTELCDPEVEPAVVEAVERYRSNPTTEDNRIRLETLKGEHLAFLCSDVLSYEWATKDSPAWDMLYPLNVKMWRAPDGSLIYFVHEDNIIGVLNA